MTEREYNAIAEHMPVGSNGPFALASLPARPTAAQLPRHAADRFGRWLRAALLELAPTHVVTLGQEPWSTLALLDGVVLDHPAASVSDSRTSGYGRTGGLIIEGHRMDWTPLAHPGLIRQASKTSADGWRAVHERWLKAGRRTRT